MILDTRSHTGGQILGHSDCIVHQLLIFHIDVPDYFVKPLIHLFESMVNLVESPIHLHLESPDHLHEQGDILLRCRCRIIGCGHEESIGTDAMQSKYERGILRVLLDTTSR